MSASVLFDAPGPRARARNAAISVAAVAVAVLLTWIVFARLTTKGQLTLAKWKPFLAGDLWQTYVLPGIVGTLLIGFNRLRVMLSGEPLEMSEHGLSFYRTNDREPPAKPASLSNEAHLVEQARTTHEAHLVEQARPAAEGGS